MLHTTLEKIRAKSPSSDGWGKLLTNLGKTKSDDDPLSFKTILQSNGLNDAIWCLRTVDGYDKELRLFAVWCARQVESLDPTGVAKATNDVSERYAQGIASAEELTAAWAAALAARDAARCAAWAAARAAWAASDARPDAWSDAWSAAWSAALATRAAAGAAQKEQFIKMFCTEVASCED